MSTDFLSQLSVFFNTGKCDAQLKSFLKKASLDENEVNLIIKSKKFPLGNTLHKLCKILNVSEEQLRIKTNRIDYKTGDKLSGCQSFNNLYGEGVSDTFKTEKGIVYQSDCLNYMKSMADFSVDLVFADPPFNLNKMYPSKMDDMVPEEKYIRWCEEWVTQCCRILKHGGSIFIWNLPRWNTQISRVLEQYVEFRNWISVEMTYSLPIKGRLYPSHYSLLYYVKGEKPNTFNPDRLPMKICRACFQEQKDYGGYKNKMNPLGINLSDVWTDISPVRHSKYKTRDSNELPLRLMDRIIQMSTKEGDIVFDPFGGSGTTYIAAELLNRRWIGTELGPLLDIKNRFNSLEIEKAHLDQIRSTTNVLFSSSVKAERRKRHLWIPEDFQNNPIQESMNL